MQDNKNLFIAIGLSLMVLLGWQFLVLAPQEAKRRAALEQQQVTQQQNEITKPATAQNGAQGGIVPSIPADGASGAAPVASSSATAAIGGSSIQQALSANERIRILSDRLEGSINLVGGRIDDVLLRDYRETIEDGSPLIRLLHPVGSAGAYYAETGFVTSAGGPTLPDSTTLWQVEGNNVLSSTKPVTLRYDNGAGLRFKRVYTVDENYLFTITDHVENTTGEPVTLYPYGFISRLGKPKTSGIYILHEGLIGVFGADGLAEIKYNDLDDEVKTIEEPQADKGWLGITDKYWAATLIPPADKKFKGRFAATANGGEAFQADFLSDPMTIAGGGSGETTTRLFAGAKETTLLDTYQEQQGIDRFELLIDWGWFYFLTKNLFYALDWLFRLFGNFGIAILTVTIVIKIAFFWFANRSYVSMSRMKLVQPKLKELQERHKDDKARLQQEMMKLYKEEKINPLAGCWPVLIQIPVFFSLYKVLYVTIEMRHTPFFGWIQDLAAPDPTTVFNLFGLIPYDVPAFLPVLGIWPLIMGVTMFIQMKLNPAPPDPTQQFIFNWMPVIFTIMLASFPAGLVIYWAWNNTLSVIQQYVIMKRQGVDVDILGNILDGFKRNKSAAANGNGKPDQS